MSQKGAVHLIVILAVLAVLGGLVWFFLLHKDSNKYRSFQDVSPKDKNYAAVEYLFREGILERDESKLFNPAKVVNRFEWVKMLVNLTGITPAKDIYKNCFSDVGKGRNEAIICFAKEQGWLKGFEAERQAHDDWEFVQTARAQQTKEDFNPDRPIKKDEAIGSLSLLMNWKTDQAVDFANEHKIIKGDVKGNLTKGDAAGIIYRSVATVPLKNEIFSKELENQVERYKIDELIDLNDELARERREEDAYWRKERAKKYAKMFGEQTSAEIVAEAEKFEDEFQAIDAENNAYLKKAREKNYEQMLAEDKALGKETPEYNILEPLQKVFAAKGGVIPSDYLVIFKRTPPHYDNEQITSNPLIKSRDGATIVILLDEKYNVISAANLAKAKYAISIVLSSFYTDGRTLGHVTIKLTNFVTGVDEKAASMRRFNLNNLDEVLQSRFNELEVEIGQVITPPTIVSPTPKTNDYSDGYFEFLDIATGQPSIALSTASKPHIIVAAEPGKGDVRNWLPIKLELKKDGNVTWTGTISGDVSKVCRGPTGCSTNGPTLDSNWKSLELKAYDKNGKVVATFGETYNR